MNNNGDTADNGDTNGDIGNKCYQMYVESLMRVRNNTHDMVDEVLVAMWNSVDALNQKFKSLQEVCNQQAQTIAQYYSQHDLLHSRIAQLSGEKSLNEWQPDGGMQ